MSDQQTNRTTTDWLVDLCVYAPIGFALDLPKYVPEFADRGRKQVALARFLGKFALERVEKHLGPLGAVLHAPKHDAGSTATTGPAAPPRASTSAAPDTATDFERSSPEPTRSNAAQADPSEFERSSTDSAQADPADPSEFERSSTDSAQADPAPDELPLRGSAVPSSTAATPSPGGARPPTQRKTTPTSASAVAQPVPRQASAPAPSRRAKRAAVAPQAKPAASSPRTDRSAATAKTTPTEASRRTPRKASGAVARSTAGSAKRAGRPHRAADPAGGPDVPPKEDQLAVEGYATLAASQIVPRLATLGRDDLGAIQRFERANRNRRTILNRVDQLLTDR